MQEIGSTLFEHETAKVKVTDILLKFVLINYYWHIQI